MISIIHFRIGKNYTIRVIQIHYRFGNFIRYRFSNLFYPKYTFAEEEACIVFGNQLV